MADNTRWMTVDSPNGISSFDQLMRRTPDNPFIMGTTGTGASNYINGASLKLVFGASIKIIFGFPGASEIRLAAVRGELGRVRSEAVDVDELERAKSYLIGSHQIAMQRRSAIANAIAYHEAYGLGWSTWSGFDDAIRGVTPADVAATLDGARKTVGALGREPRIARHRQ